MTEIVTCARCHCKFERTCVENEKGEREEVLTHLPKPGEECCEDCEHEFLAWAGCRQLF
jgi:hypothetical protein